MPSEIVFDILIFLCFYHFSLTSTNIFTFLYKISSTVNRREQINHFTFPEAIFSIYVIINVIRRPRMI